MAQPNLSKAIREFEKELGFAIFKRTAKGVRPTEEGTVNETNGLGTMSNVVDRGYNLGIIRYQMIDENCFLTMMKNNPLSYETIWEFEYVLVISKRHPLADKEVVSLICWQMFPPLTSILGH